MLLYNGPHLACLITLYDNSHDNLLTCNFNHGTVVLYKNNFGGRQNEEVLC